MAAAAVISNGQVMRREHRRARKTAVKGNLLRTRFDLQQGRCYWCGEIMVMQAFLDKDGRQIVDPHKATLDHVVPLVAEGATDLKNCVAACDACNQLRAQYNTAAWRRERDRQERRHRADYANLENWMLSQLKKEQEHRRAAEDAVAMHLATIEMITRPESGWQRFWNQLRGKGR